MPPSAPSAGWTDGRVDAVLVERLRAIAGEGGVVADPAGLQAYRGDSVHRAEGGILCVARPAGTEQVAEVVRACRAAGVPIVPRGGGTGFAGGSLPIAGQSVVMVSLERMRRIRSLDPVGDVIVVDAGCVLHEVRQAAAAAGRVLGLDHGGAGSSSSGGTVATNAGGNNVVRYGMARDQVLGIEAVLADGSVLGPPSVLRKSNAGYDLRHLLTGSEGTLALITAVALKLRPAPVACVTAMLGVASPQQAVELFALARTFFGDAISAFELMSRPALEFHFAHVGARREPLADPTPWLALLECESTSRFMDLDAAIQGLFEQALADGLVSTGSVATSLAQRRAMWVLREGIAVAMGAASYHIVKTDTAVPTGSVAEFIRRADLDVERALPGSRTVAFGHVGDGNIHLNILPPAGMPDQQFRARSNELAAAIDEIALSLGGTVSAEHGIGQAKRQALRRMLPAPEIALMRAIKRAFDPDGIFNPGKMIADD